MGSIFIGFIRTIRIMFVDLISSNPLALFHLLLFLSCLFVCLFAAVSIFNLPECELAPNPGQKNDSSSTSTNRGTFLSVIPLTFNLYIACDISPGYLQPGTYTCYFQPGRGIPPAQVTSSPGYLQLTAIFLKSIVFSDSH